MGVVLLKLLGLDMLAVQSSTPAMLGGLLHEPTTNLADAVSCIHQKNPDSKAVQI